MRDKNDDIDLIDPGFTRGSLEAAEQQFILEQFAAHVGRVSRKVNDGKEATVYVCEGIAGAPLLAAKIYRARRFRAFRGERAYAEHRVIRDRRIAKAVAQRSRKGNVVGQALWIDHEWRMLNLLAEAGVSVPAPIACGSAGILMEFISDGLDPAPRLIDVAIDMDVLALAWASLLGDVARMLDVGVVHGDLSAYNVLWSQGRPRIIDLPQALDVGAPDARRYFERDLANLSRYFERGGVETRWREALERMWPL